MNMHLDAIHRDVLQEILFYLNCTDLATVREMNKILYKRTIGFEKPGLVGVENKPANNRSNLPGTASLRAVDFKDLDLQIMPSSVFDGLVASAINRPIAK